LIEDPTYLQIAGHGSGGLFAGKEFINYLLKQDLIVQKSSTSVNLGDLIIYFLDEEFKHIGRMQSQSRVISKWGTGLLYGHNIWDVPSDYGSEVRYYEGPDADRSFELFITYAKSKGLSFESR
jgi:hypothetical protein